jgi:hypothetical protein
MAPPIFRTKLSIVVIAIKGNGLREHIAKE